MSRFLSILPHLGGSWEGRWAVLGRLEGVLDHLGGALSLNSRRSSFSPGALAAPKSWGRVGASWEGPGRVLEPSWGVLRASWAILKEPGTKYSQQNETELRHSISNGMF